MLPNWVACENLSLNLRRTGKTCKGRLFLRHSVVTVNSDYRDCYWIFPSVGDTFVRWKHLQCFCTFSGIGVIVYSVPTPAITLSGTSQQLVLQVTSLFSPSNKSASTNFLFISYTYICIPYFLHITEQLFQLTFFNRDAKIEPMSRNIREKDFC